MSVDALFWVFFLHRDASLITLYSTGGTSMWDGREAILKISKKGKSILSSHHEAQNSLLPFFLL